MRDTITVGKVELNGGRFCLVVAREDIPVTLYEFRILRYLMTNKGEIQTHDQIIEAYRGAGASVTSEHLYVHVSKINQKIGFRFIEAVRGVGYVVQAEATVSSRELPVPLKPHRQRSSSDASKRDFGLVSDDISSERDSHGKTKYCQRCGLYMWKKYDHRRSTANLDLCNGCGGDAVREADFSDVPAIDPSRAESSA